MIVKIINGETERYVDCISAVIKASAIDVETGEKDMALFCIVRGVKDLEISLHVGDMVFYMNNEGKTIDKDFRMVHEKQNEPLT